MRTITKKFLKEAKASFKKEKELEQKILKFSKEKGSLTATEEMRMRRLHDQYLIVRDSNRKKLLTPKLVLGSPTLVERVKRPRNTVFITGECPSKMLRALLEGCNLIEVRERTDFVEKTMLYASRVSYAKVLYSRKAVKDQVESVIKSSQRVSVENDLMIGDGYWSDAFFG